VGQVTIGYAALQYKVAGFGGLRKEYRDTSEMLVQGGYRMTELFSCIPDKSLESPSFHPLPGQQWRQAA
jgi:hypothetical protein